VFKACSIEFFFIFQKYFRGRFYYKDCQRALVGCGTNTLIIILSGYYNHYLPLCSKVILITPIQPVRLRYCASGLRSEKLKEKKKKDFNWGKKPVSAISTLNWGFC